MNRPYPLPLLTVGTMSYFFGFLPWLPCCDGLQPGVVSPNHPLLLEAPRALYKPQRDMSIPPYVHISIHTFAVLFQTPTCITELGTLRPGTCSSMAACCLYPQPGFHQSLVQAHFQGREVGPSGDTRRSLTTQ